MGGMCVIAAARGVDLYLVWSTETDSPVHVGDRHETATWIRGHWAGETAESALDRADQTGTSDQSLLVFGCWGDEWLAVGEGSPGDGWYRLHRRRVRDYASALLAGDTAAAGEVLECWYPLPRGD